MNKEVITIYIPSEVLIELNKIVDNHIFPNRSMLVNNCIEIALPIIYEQIKELNKNIETENLPEVFKFLKERGFIIKTGIQPTIKLPLGNIHFNSHNIKKEVKIQK